MQTPDEVTVENSPDPSSVYIRLCKHRKKVFYFSDFSRIKCQLKRKKNCHTFFVTIFSCNEFQPRKKWVNKANLSSFELENFFKFVLA